MGNMNWPMIMTIISGVSSLAVLGGMIVAIVAVRSTNKIARRSEERQDESDFRNAMENRFSEIRGKMNDGFKELRKDMNDGLRENRKVTQGIYDFLLKK